MVAELDQGLQQMSLMIWADTDFPIICYSLLQSAVAYSKRPCLWPLLKVKFEYTPSGNRDRWPMQLEQGPKKSLLKVQALPTIYPIPARGRKGTLKRPNPVALRSQLDCYRGAVSQLGS